MGFLLEKYLKRIDILNKLYNEKKISKKKKNKGVDLCSRKIKNKVTEMHWKTIKYLIDNYKNILIGDISSKSITSNKTSILNDMTKRKAFSLSFTEFRKKLKYKCKVNKINYLLVEEYYTSKLCSKCGNLKKNLSGNKEYKCSKCKIELDRDVNGARNIFIRGNSKI